MSQAAPVESSDRIKGTGTFTPPPPPCGGPDCRYEGFDVIHDATCEEAD